MPDAPTSLYRKYRPQAFSDVLGQEHIVSVLEGAVKEKGIAHAYLFAGSRGTGKTSVARILARAIGASPNDIYEMDAASHTGVDDIRELREAVTSLPLESPYKVYIIDEVHMLSRAAFNALLKTLEEPPKHAVFVLATTELHKLPDTVISRCQSFTFKKPTQQMLRSVIEDIAKQEKYQIDTASADLIALLAEGSFRDAQSILQKVLGAAKGAKIAIEEVERVTGAPGGTLINDFLGALAEKEVEKGLASLEKAAEQNIDMNVFLKRALQKLRMVLLLRNAPNIAKEHSKHFSDEDQKLLHTWAAEKKETLNSTTLKALLDAYAQTGRSAIPQLPTELAVIEVLGAEREA